MNDCIESMVQEHELIVEVLAALWAMAEALEAGRRVPREDIAGFARFFKDFADQCHHGKEEDRLFVRMVEAGFPREFGPVAVMLAEHEAGRREVRGLGEIGAGAGPLSQEEAACTVEHARAFVPLLYSHIQKENNMLYPMARQAIPAGDMSALNQACAAFDCEARERLDVAGLKELAAELKRRYPANATSLAVLGGCGACHVAA